MWCYISTGNLRRHQQSAHEGIRYEFNQCNHKAITQEGHLKVYVESVYEGIRYECNQCDYKAPSKITSEKDTLNSGLWVCCTSILLYKNKNRLN